MTVPYTPDLVTLEYVLRHRGLENITIDADDKQLFIDFIHGVSAEIQESLIYRTAMPYADTVNVDYTGDVTKGAYLINARALFLRAYDLLAVTTLTNDGETIAASEYVLRPANRYPHYEVRLKASSNRTWDYSTDIEDAISIAGAWGYAPNYDRCWRNSGVTVPAGGVSDSATSLTLGSSEGASFETLQYIQINAETLQITDISGDTLTVTRGELGTTAAAHDADTAIRTYQQLRDIVAATTEIIVYRYLSKDKVGGRVNVYDNIGMVVEDLDPMTKRAIRAHRRGI